MPDETQWKRQQTRAMTYLKGAGGVPRKVTPGFGQSNSARFIPGALLLGVFNLDNFATWRTTPIVFVGCLSAPGGTEHYLAILIEEGLSTLIAELEKLKARVRLNNVRAYLLEGGEMVVNTEFLDDGGLAKGTRIPVDRGTVVWFSSAPEYLADSGVIGSNARRFAALTAPRPVERIDLDNPEPVPSGLVPVNPRLLTCLASKPFLILTGPSGTGKTRGIRELVQALRPSGQAEDFHNAFVAVEADWTDARHLLGYYNPFGKEGQGTYEITPVLAVLLRASLPEWSRQPFFIVLDEMNLSHVERYFARFLSLMETAQHGLGRGEHLLSIFDLQAALRTTDDGVLKAAIQKAIGEKGFYLPPNVFFAGTVNVDETTYMFSPKVLDRAFVVECEARKPSETRMALAAEDPRPRCTVSQVAGFLLAGITTRSDLTDLGLELERKLDALLEALFVATAGDTPEAGPAPSLLDRLNTMMDDMGFPIADRLTIEIERLVLNRAHLASLLADDSLVALPDTLGEIMVTKVLPKLHGGRKQVEKGLVRLKDFCVTQNVTLPVRKLDRLLAQVKDTGYCGWIS